MKKIGVYVLCLLISVMSASAFVDLTIEFNKNNVEVLGYDCLNADCSKFRSFSGSFPEGKTTNNGKLLVIFPSSMATPHGYAFFAVNKGSIPQEGRFRQIHSSGDNGHFPARLQFPSFGKINQCQAVVDEFSIKNEVHPNEPVVVDIKSALDAATSSAFKKVNNGIGFIPKQLEDEYYASDVEVKLEVKNASGDVIKTKTKSFTAAKGNSIKADDKIKTQFSFTPEDVGEHKAVITSTVVDDQCASHVPSKAKSTFTVIPTRPANQCYTILNALDIDTAFPEVNKEITASFTKISNFGDAAIGLTPIATNISYEVKDASGTVVLTNSILLDANNDAVNPEQQSFSFIPTTSGQHTVEVTGIGVSPLCAGLSNIAQSQSAVFTVKETPSFEVTFNIISSTDGSALENVKVEVGNKESFTNNNGIAKLDGLQGTITYTLSKPGFATLSDTLVVDSDKTIAVTLDEFVGGNNAPVAQGFTVNVNENEAATITLLCTDPDNDPVTFTINNPKKGSLSGNGPEVTYTPNAGFFGQDSLSYSCTDGQLESTTAKVIINVVEVNAAPVAVINAPANANMFQQLIFNASTSSDVDNDPLTFTWNFGDGTVASGAVATHAFTTPGNFVVTLTVSDGSAESTATKGIAVAAVNNNAPVAQNLQATTNEEQAVGMTLSCSDADNDQLSFIVVQTPTNGVLSGNGATRTYVPNLNFAGQDTFTYKCFDGQADSNVATASITVNNVNDAPQATDLQVITAVNTSIQISLLCVDPDNDPLTFSLDESPEDGVVVFNGNVATYTPNTNFVGADDFEFICSDGQLADQGEVDITVQGQGTIGDLDFIFNPSNPRRFESTTFTAIVNGSTSGISFNWYFGDGTVGQGSTVGHSFLTAGTFNVRLTATQGSAIASVTKQITVSELPGGSTITITSTPPSQAEVGTPINFDILAQSSAGLPLTFVKDLGPSGLQVNPTTGAVTYTALPQDIGLQKVRIIVTDFLSFTTLSFDLRVISAGASVQDAELNRDHLALPHVRFLSGEVARPGDELIMSVRIENDGRSRLDDVVISVVSQELGIRGRAGPFDVGKNDEEFRRVITYLPRDAAPGEYVLRISVGNGKERRVIHRPIRVL